MRLGVIRIVLNSLFEGIDRLLILVPRLEGRYARVGTIAKIEDLGRIRGGTEALVIRGLGRASIGVGVAGTGEAIAQGRLYRKRLGGGMRQAGVLAAAGLIALEEHPKLLRRDHENARFLATALARIPGIGIDAPAVQTNIVIFDVSGTGLTPSEFSARLKQRDVLINGINAHQMRIVTHYDVDRAGCQQALEMIEQVAAGAVAGARA